MCDCASPQYFMAVCWFVCMVVQNSPDADAQSSTSVSAMCAHCQTAGDVFLSKHFPISRIDFTLCTPPVCCLLNGQPCPAFAGPAVYVRHPHMSTHTYMPSPYLKDFCTCTSASHFHRLQHFRSCRRALGGAAAQMFCSMRLASSASRARRLKPRWLLDSLACTRSAAVTSRRCHACVPRLRRNARDPSAREP